MVKKFGDGDVLHSKVGFYLYYWIIVFFIAFIFLNAYSPYIGVQGIDLRLLVSVVSFLFGFLISISFSMILSRTSSLRDSLSIETGRIISLFNLSKDLGKEFHYRIKDLIDEYTIVTLKNYTHYEIGRPIVDSLFKATNLIELKKDLQKTKASSFLSTLNDFVITREKLEYLTSERLLPTIKLINYVLGITLIFLLFLNRGNQFSNLLFVILSTVVIFLLLIIEDYEDLRIGDYVNNISNSEQIFDLIGKERYYPYSVLGRVKLSKDVVYRVGVYDKQLGERIVKLTYSPYFSGKNIFVKKN